MDSQFDRNQIKFVILWLIKNDDFDMDPRTKQILYGISLEEDEKEKFEDANKFNKKSGLSGSAAIKESSLHNRFIISENSTWKAIFDLWISLIVGYSCFTSIYYVAFGSPSSLGQQIFDWIVEACFLLDLIFHFFQEYKDPETFEMVRDLKKISKKYIKGWFIIDLTALFPFQLMIQNGSRIIKLVRLLRLPKLIDMLDISRFNKLLKSFFENSSRDERIAAQYILRYIYKIFRLILIAIIITYFVGVFWYIIADYFNTDDAHDRKETFLEYHGLDQNSDWKNLIIVCYYTLTTLATVGYGDYYPVSNVERIFAVFIMLLGVAFFSFIMGNFIEIIANYDKKMGAIDKGAELQNWMTLLTRFTGNKPLPKELINAIDNHFTYFWKNYRLASISPDDPYLNSLPKSIKRKILTDYLFGDIFYKFKVFFRTSQFPDSKYLYDMAFGFLPRKFCVGEVIYEEEEEVPEMYLILEGTVEVGFTIGRESYFGKYLMRRSYFGEYYLLANKKSEFLYRAVEEVKAIGIPKGHFISTLEKHEEQYKLLKGDAISRYREYLRKPLLAQKEKKLKSLNASNTYTNIKFEDKPEVKLEEVEQDKDEELDLNTKIKNKVEKISNDIEEFTNKINNFAEHYDKELEDLLSGIQNIQGKMTSLKK